MKGKKNTILTFVLAFLCFALSIPVAGAATLGAAGSPRALQFEETSFDFGDIREDGGQVTHTFRFRNTGTTPVVILRAESTCGCTVPTFSRKPVMSSESGSIEVSFDPMNRPGSVEKKITIATSEGGEPVRLWIYGNVLPREKGIDELYPAYVGNGVRAETTFHSFAYIEHGHAARTSAGLINTSDKRVKVNVFNCSDRKIYGIEGFALPVILDAGERREITIVADLERGRDVYGTVTEHLCFEIDGRRSDAELVVTGIAIDDRSRWSEESRPRSEVDRYIVKMGQFSHDSGSVAGSFVISNRGTAPLAVRAVEGCAAGTRLSIAAGDVIAAGESRRVEVTVDPALKGYGPVVEKVRLITDDPARPVTDLKVTMLVD